MLPINIKVSVKPPAPALSTTVTPGTIPYMYKEDRDVQGYIRSCAPCPAVVILKEDSHSPITKQWQYYMIAINPSMTLENIYLLLDDHLAFCNNTGFATLDNPGRKDFFFNRTNFEKNPQFDKVRTCSRNVVTGIEKNGMLSVKTFDIRNAPPLKPGRFYPRTIDEINPDDYLYTPRYNREMFIVANIVNRAGEVVQFPRGGLYDWTNDSTPYSFLPLCSNPTYGEVLVPLSKFVKLPKDSPVPSPYRRN
jgi:hypothetical protein